MLALIQQLPNVGSGNLSLTSSQSLADIPGLDWATVVERTPYTGSRLILTGSMKNTSIPGKVVLDMANVATMVYFTGHSQVNLASLVLTNLCSRVGTPADGMASWPQLITSYVWPLKPPR